MLLLIVYYPLNTPNSSYSIYPCIHKGHIKAANNKHTRCVNVDKVNNDQLMVWFCLRMVYFTCLSYGLLISYRLMGMVDSNNDT